MSKEIERRFFPAEVRVAGDPTTGQQRIVGYSALFDSESEDLGGFTERLAPSCFTQALKKIDCRYLFNHDPNHVLGRTTSGTLTLEQDATGLRVENTPPDTQWARDLLVSMSRGDISGQSFGFRVAPNGDQWDTRDGRTVRTITDIAELVDCSVVTYPAYRQTDASVALRSLGEWQRSHEDPPLERRKDERRKDEPEVPDPTLVLERQRLLLAEVEQDGAS